MRRARYAAIHKMLQRHLRVNPNHLTNKQERYLRVYNQHNQPEAQINSQISWHKHVTFQNCKKKYYRTTVLRSVSITAGALPAGFERGRVSFCR